jgi:recombinational DNA repair ATPase RecF
MATVERIDINGKIVSFLGFNGEGKTGQSLIEGVSHRGSMHPKDSMVFRVDVKQL